MPDRRQTRAGRCRHAGQFMAVFALYVAREPGGAVHRQVSPSVGKSTMLARRSAIWFLRWSLETFLPVRSVT